MGLDVHFAREQVRNRLLTGPLRGRGRDDSGVRLRAAPATPPPPRSTSATSAGGPGELYILNPANGAIVQNVGPLNDAGATNYPMTGMAYNPNNGLLYGSTGNSGTNPATECKLVTINPATAQVTVIGPFNVGNGASMADIDFDSAGNLYGIATNGGARASSPSIPSPGKRRSSAPADSAAPPAGAWRSAPRASSMAHPSPPTLERTIRRPRLHQHRHPRPSRRRWHRLRRAGLRPERHALWR